LCYFSTSVCCCLFRYDSDRKLLDTPRICTWYSKLEHNFYSFFKISVRIYVFGVDYNGNVWLLLCSNTDFILSLTLGTVHLGTSLSDLHGDNLLWTQIHAHSNFNLLSRLCSGKSRLYVHDVTNSFEHNPSWEASKKFAILYGTGRFIAVFTMSGTGPYP